MTPETVFIAITFADGSVGIMQFVTKDLRAGWARPATAENVAAEIARSAWDSGKTPIKGWRIIRYEDIPKDRTYRNALRDDGANLTHDMPHARELHREHLREARAPLLAALDVEYQRADERGDANTKRDVADRKQALRDVTDHPGIEAAQTTDELKAVWPLDK